VSKRIAVASILVALVAGFVGGFATRLIPSEPTPDPNLMPYQAITVGAGDGYETGFIYDKRTGEVTRAFSRKTYTTHIPPTW
jgi:hypothetical protein